LMMTFVLSMFFSVILGPLAPGLAGVNPGKARG
jgi:hypothetical protein